MQYNLQDSVALLARTPVALNALLRDLPETWTLRNEGEGTWSAFDIVGHLIHGERTDWMPRAKMILQFGEAKAFEPFDRRAQERESQGKSLAQLLDEFARLRSESLDELRALDLQPEALPRRGRHPALGVVTFVPITRDLGRSRVDASASNLARHGLPIPRRGGPVEHVSRRAAMRRPQRTLKLVRHRKDNSCLAPAAGAKPFPPFRQK